MYTSMWDGSEDPVSLTEQKAMNR
jgi:hypothetical protein